MLERSRIGGAIYNFCDRARGDEFDRRNLHGLIEPFMPIAVQDMKNGLKSDQAAAALMFRLVNEFSQTKFLQRLYEQNWEAFASIARVYVTVVSEVSNRPTYYAYALALHDNEAHEELQGMVLRAPQG